MVTSRAAEYVARSNSSYRRSASDDKAAAAESSGGPANRSTLAIGDHRIDSIELGPQESVARNGSGLVAAVFYSKNNELFANQLNE